MKALFYQDQFDKFFEEICNWDVNQDIIPAE